MRKWLIGTALSLLLWGPAAFADTVLVVGDSISAAFGLDTRQGWVALLEKRLVEQGFDHRVVNASISGDTSAGGAARLPALLTEHQPELVIIELGGNDGLRGQPPMQLQQNLAAMVEQSQKVGAKVLILGMRLPPNYGVRYTTAFAEVFPQVAAETGAELVPFVLEGIGGVPSMVQSDGIHPTAEAQPRLLDNVWPLLKPML
ncbi:MULTISPECIES: arylesterase [Pseudomonas]|uniref:Arylesterase n=1 Tax=Pseudomonas spirodelae TaxID=3101751 RepID=A0ABU5P8V1_9PSED|nr:MULTISPECIES: arylesterase [unclassified Pseudomonas]MBU0900486.1 arylesterase [Gammaproteobacteria bacterium]MDD2159540.1 arylesterase [Pseudomonas sp. MIL19]MEA1606074.1 arylesterase [Pseudomonas sp. T5W1]